MRFPRPQHMHTLISRHLSRHPCPHSPWVGFLRRRVDGAADRDVFITVADARVGSSPLLSASSHVSWPYVAVHSVLAWS